ncbi:NAD-dependent epimerase/dehydratase family protein [Psychroflexus lacisalsi]|jgi:CDP-paratose synthetase|uniref:NAD(P)-dependent oxidoreductase n=1 Tax=Psychroflexus lacisalsi TaxID=503928 RepID=A0ABN1K4L5_9FLAO|nr:NAD(P)-dependent oxidoreductase [Psychroflexus lacisalsi]MBZ9618859.1 NAD(P)-dependent oxidoreductase [Psychroflexus lacisalsi]
MRILITGATGYVGQNFIPKLISLNAEIKILTVNLTVEKASKLYPSPQCNHISTEEIDKIAEFDPEIVYHLATLSTSRNDTDIISSLISANIEFGVKLLDSLKNCKNIRIFVNFGSFAEYRLGPQKINDAYLYTATKSAFRCFVDYYSNLVGFKYITLIPYTVYGGKGTAKKLIDFIKDSIDSVEPVNMTKGEQILDFIHIEDVVSFLILIYEKISKFESLKNGEEFHLGTGKGTKVKDLAKMIEIFYNKKCNVNWGGIPYRPMDTMYAVAPIAKNIEILDWKTTLAIEERLD